MKKQLKSIDDSLFNELPKEKLNKVTGGSSTVVAPTMPTPSASYNKSTKETDLHDDDNGD